MHYWLYKFVQRVHNITTSKKQLYRLVNTMLNLPQTCAEKLSFAVVQKMVDTLKFHWNYVYYWLYKFVHGLHNITTNKKQLYRLVNTLLNLPQTCTEKLSFAVVQKRVDTLKFHWNYVHYLLYKFVQRVHNITTSKKQLYRLVNTLLNLPQTCAEKLSFALVQKRVDTLKFHWKYLHYWLYKFVQRVHNITTRKKQLYRLVNTLLNLPQTCAEKLSFAVVQKKVDTLKFHWNYVHYWLYKFLHGLHNITTSKKQIYWLVNTLLNLPQTCAEKLSFAVVQKRVDTLKFHWNYVHYWLYKFVQRVHNITTSKKQLYRLVNTLLNLPQTCAEKLSFAVVQKKVDTLKFHWKYVHYWLYKFVQRVHNITTSKEQLYKLVNTLLNLPQTCAEKLSVAVVQKKVDLKFHWNYVHYWLYKFVQRVHNITTSKTQIYRLVNILLNLPQTCAEKLSFAVVQKRVDTLKFHWNYVHYWLYKFVHRVYNITTSKKQLYRLVNTLLNLPQTCAEKLSFAVVQKKVDTEISLKLYALLALQVCAKGAQHHNKQKTTLQTCKHHAKFAANLCRKVEFCRSTKEGRHFEISLKLCVLLALQVCAWPAQLHNKQKTTLQACKHLAKFAANLYRKVEFCRSTKEGRHFEISLKLCALLALQVCAKGAQHHNKQKTTLKACKHLAKFAANLCRKVEFCRSTKKGRHFEISLKLCALLALQVCAKGAQHHNKQKTTLQACKHFAKFAATLCRKVKFCRSTKEGRRWNFIEIMCIIGSTSLCMACTTSQQAKNNSTGL